MLIFHAQQVLRQTVIGIPFLLRLPLMPAGECEPEEFILHSAAAESVEPGLTGST